MIGTVFISESINGINLMHINPFFSVTVFRIVILIAVLIGENLAMSTVQGRKNGAVPTLRRDEIEKLMNERQKNADFSKGGLL